jgi:hypothetical protein
MAGTINLALSQQFDMDGEPLSGGLLYFFAASTTTPQNSFQDLGLTIVNPNPLVLDASGRVPMFYLADGNIKIRLADKNGVTVIAADNILVIGPSSGGGGGGGGVDVTTVLATGDIKARYGTGTLDGFVRCNGNTIGQTGSSATELAGPKAQALYEYLWAFPNVLLDGASKGANANADFLALKRLVVPDMRGRGIVGLDDMGAAAANRLTSTYFGASGIVLGNVGGDEKHLLALANLPTHTPGGSVSVTVSDHSYTPAGSVSTTGGSSSGNNSVNSGSVPVWMGTDGVGGGLSQGVGLLTSTFTGTAATISHTVSNTSFTGNPINPGGATAHATMSPAMALTIYIKL